MLDKKRKKKIYYQLNDEMKKSHYFIIKMNEQAALSILKTMSLDNFCIEQLKVKQAIESILDSYQQEKEKNKNLIKQLREKEQENIKMRSNFLLSLNDFILKDKIRAFIKKETFEGRYSFDLISAKRLQKLLSEDKENIDI